MRSPSTLPQTLRVTSQRSKRSSEGRYAAAGGSAVGSESKKAPGWSHHSPCVLHVLLPLGIGSDIQFVSSLYPSSKLPFTHLCSLSSSHSTLITCTFITTRLSSSQQRWLLEGRVQSCLTFYSSASSLVL